MLIPLWSLRDARDHAHHKRHASPSLIVIGTRTRTCPTNTKKITFRTILTILISATLSSLLTLLELIRPEINETNYMLNSLSFIWHIEIWSFRWKISCYVFPKIPRNLNWCLMEHGESFYIFSLISVLKLNVPLEVALVNSVKLIFYPSVVYFDLKFIIHF